MKRDFIEGVILAFRGWKVWHNICKKYLKYDSMLIFIPSIQPKYNYCSMLYLDDLLRARGYNSAVLLTVDPEMEKVAHKYTSKITKILNCTESSAKCLSQFYAICNFDNRFVYASFDVEHAKGIDYISQISGFDYEEAFALAIYRLKPYSKQVCEELEMEII